MKNQKGYFPEYKDTPPEILLSSEAPQKEQYTEEQLLQLHYEEELQQLAETIEYPDPRDLK